MNKKQSKWLETQVLKRGAHNNPSEGLCVMEAAAYIAGEPHSDHPSCVSPFIAGFLRLWNDDMNDVDRQMLKPLIPKIIGTDNTTAKLKKLCESMVADWFMRVYTPEWLDLAGMKNDAESLRRTFEPNNAEYVVLLVQIQQRAAAVREVAKDAARRAAGVVPGSSGWYAIGDVIGDVAREAIWCTAGDAAQTVVEYAAESSFLTVAKDVAQAAAEDAVWAITESAFRAATTPEAKVVVEFAAQTALRPTVVKLQASALDLVERLIAVH